MSKEINTLIHSQAVESRIMSTLGSEQKSRQFKTTLLSLVNSNQSLHDCMPVSVISSALLATTLDLPINQNLGFAYIVPFNKKNEQGVYEKHAQFQLGYKGYIQLAQRSGQFKTISACEIHSNQLKSKNPLTGYEFSFDVEGNGEIIGYASYFELLNGFSKTMFMSIDQIKNHSKKYSQTAKKGYGLWEDNFDSMAIKTVLKLLLSKYAPLSVEMQRAIVNDSAIVGDDFNVPFYVDNTPEPVDKEEERVYLMLENASSFTELVELEKHAKTPEQKEKIRAKMKELQSKK